jgi:pimeloyl-ACP methyl ester carboxylesterase
MIPGLDSVKEELQATAEYLLARGLAVIAIDGPGQGETEYELPIEPAYERVTTAVADYLKGRDDIDPDRIGVFGVSLGGYYAARSAAYEPRVRAAVDLAGPYRFDLDWDTLAPQTRTTFQHRSGAASAAQAREQAATLTLEEAAPRITCPLLVVHGGRDRLIPAYHAERLAREAPGAELLLYPDGGHGVTNHAFESRAAIADWLAARLLPHALIEWREPGPVRYKRGRDRPPARAGPDRRRHCPAGRLRAPARLRGGAPDRRGRPDPARPGRLRRARHRHQRARRQRRIGAVPGAAAVRHRPGPGAERDPG